MIFMQIYISLKSDKKSSNSKFISCIVFWKFENTRYLMQIYIFNKITKNI